MLEISQKFEYTWRELDALSTDDKEEKGEAFRDENLIELIAFMGAGVELSFCPLL